MLFALSKSVLQHALDRFVISCDSAGMKINVTNLLPVVDVTACKRLLFRDKISSFELLPKVFLSLLSECI